MNATSLILRTSEAAVNLVHLAANESQACSDAESNPLIAMSPKQNRGGLNGVRGVAPKREAFITSRQMDFFSERELVTQTGHSLDNWPVAVVKELIDNSIDACEDAGIAPEISVTVSAGEIVVADNGPGIPAATVDAVLDFSVRISSRAAYVSPARGAQGNALKTVVAMPFVLDGQQGRVEIEACGVRHSISVTVDRLNQTPVIQHAASDAAVRTGTSVRLHWPTSPRSKLEEKKAAFLQIMEDYTILNPHLNLTWNLFGSRGETKASVPTWDKWRPSDHISPHWLRTEDFEKLIAGYIVSDKKNSRERTVREVVAEFDGLTSTAKQKGILKETGLTREPLSALMNGNDLAYAKIANLLEAMKLHTRPLRPEALGFIGESHWQTRFAAMGCESFQYRKKAVMVEGLPSLIEVAFGWRPGGGEQRVVTGINWSPAIPGLNPFRKIGNTSLDSLLAAARAGEGEEVLIAAHLACPRVEFKDRGKSAVVVDPATAEMLVEAIQKATQRWTKQRKSEDRNATKADHRHAAMKKVAKHEAIKNAAYRVMDAAYAKASGDGRYPASARQIMYAARGAIQEATKGTLDDKYFTKTLLPDYLEENKEKTAAWDVVFDARGSFVEPHTQTVVPLGTLRVRNYLNGIREHSHARLALPDASDAFPTCGPIGRFRTVLFVEKEGFLPLFKAVRLAERFDLAIMSTKGMSVTAARKLLDDLCGASDICVLVLHDFDKSGLSILHTLTNDSKRYSFTNRIKVVDLGLRLADVKKWQLESEAVDYKESDPTSNLEKNGATPEEVAFLCKGRDHRGIYSGRRVELNAFTSDAFINWIEEKLRSLAISKVVPPDEMLAEAYRRATEVCLANERMRSMSQELNDQASSVTVPVGLSALVEAKLATNPEKSWDAAVAELVRECKA